MTPEEIDKFMAAVAVLAAEKRSKFKIIDDNNS